ncbi:MAG: hypothetical protein M3P39_05570, partial [Actinomycetota bacterium]|nr:hypothetical protein [Actinomycetota bacterium]
LIELIAVQLLRTELAADSHLADDRAPHTSPTTAADAFVASVWGEEEQLAVASPCRKSRRWA